MNIFATCTVCHQYLCFRDKRICPKCAQRCHPLSSTPSSSSPVYLAILDEKSTKFSTLKQSFLSRWYGHGGCSVRVEQVIGIFNPRLNLKYLEFQREWLQTKKGSLATTSASGRVHPFSSSEVDSQSQQQPLLLDFSELNERRLFTPFFPRYTCKQFLPLDDQAADSTITSTSNPPPPTQTPAPPPFFGANLHHSSSSPTASTLTTMMSGSSGNRAVECCEDPHCELCQWLKTGLPLRKEGRTGRSGLAHYLSYEPDAVKPSLFSQLDHEGKRSLVKEESGGGAPKGENSTMPSTATAMQHYQQDRVYRVCILCRAVVGNTRWSGKPLGDEGDLLDQRRNQEEQQQQPPPPLRTPPFDSALVECDGVSDVVISHETAVVPVFMIVCSSEH